MNYTDGTTTPIKYINIFFLHYLGNVFKSAYFKETLIAPLALCPDSKYLILLQMVPYCILIHFCQSEFSLLTCKVQNRYNSFTAR